MSELLPAFAEPIEHPRVAFQGVEGSFSDGACVKVFGEGVERQGMDHFQYVVDAVVAGEYDYGVLPIENSSTGSINDVYDLLYDRPCYIVNETSLEITQNLMAIPGTKLSDVKFVYSHPQGLGQSQKFLQQHGIEARPYADTAMSARYIAETKPEGGAAIASKQAAEVYGLEILVPHVNFNYSNITRFVVIRNQPELASDHNKVSVVFKTAHRPGALLEALRYIADGHYDMSRIESRPVIGKPWEYSFYIDLLGQWHDAAFIDCLRKLREETEDFRVLGVYAAAEQSYL
ncbi:MAG: prephenate dehydratase domain-containing protein [Peptococcaceae bacterium]|nr:prephenate dehydratase domain-containing protein [Peptococcaceae bacterium]